MGWRDDVMKIVEENFQANEVFSLSDVYEFEDFLRKLYPRNRHVRDKIRQIMQQLRNKGIVKFLDNDGTYQRIR